MLELQEIDTILRLAGPRALTFRQDLKKRGVHYVEVDAVRVGVLRLVGDHYDPHNLHWLFVGKGPCAGIRHCYSRALIKDELAAAISKRIALRAAFLTSDARSGQNGPYVLVGQRHGSSS